MTEKQKIYPEPVVGALIINKDNKLLFSKSKKWGKDTYTVFGGHVELGEKLEDAVIREVKEETGLDVVIEKELGFGESVFEKEFHTKKHFVFIDFLCRYKGNDGSVITNDEYEKEFLWVTPEEALKLKLASGSRYLLEKYMDLTKSEEYLSGWKRCQAEFENYKKMQGESQKDMVRYASQNIILQLIPVLDNFNSSLEHVPEDQKDGGWVVGITYIQKQLEAVLFENGVSMIDIKEGDDFDPVNCEAIEDKECVSCDVKKDFKNKIKKIMQKGYKMGDRVIRPAIVIVE